ncbi:TetR/AcrR family transcriptional regulator [Rhodococcus sp. G-MC3]|uniref:TetR/AcrR family transcriptional regulator n=1 Tax=Rhodococcus sp. G-MC3 TaxID=3046209 RepID=UPI0024B91D0D|nr:TetR/AcrR family transcriptional regulator [Rhodococcus sp. G-MC3]MDJ0396245.1 TetR/AcrR family transcriptional regulator [Rhodococcus sp. G-MC3]
MPKVSAAYRQAKRDDIVDATLRVIARRGLGALTIADIIEESGFSAGSVYSHFSTKHEIIELVATRVIGDRADRLNAESEEFPRSPLETVRWWLAGLEHDELPYATAVQIWGEAASDPGIRAIAEARMAAIEDAFAAAAERWLIASGNDPSSSRDTARAMLTFCQGYIVRAAVLGRQDLESSIAAVELLTPSSDRRSGPRSSGTALNEASG